MRDSSSFANLKAKEETVQLDKYIETKIYSKFDEGIYPVVIYLNQLNQDEINLRELKTRLEELKFEVLNDKQGLDKVIKIRVKN